MLFTEAPQSVFFFSVLYALPDICNVPAQRFSGVILKLDFAAKSGVTQIHFVFVTGVLSMPLYSVDIAEWTTTAAALHDRLFFTTAVYLRRATAEGAPCYVGHSRGDLFDEEPFVSLLATNKND